MDPIVKSEHVAASPEQVWAAWTTEEGIRSFFANTSKVEAHVGGAFEMYFLPTPDEIGRGSEGSVFLALEPPRRCVFSWNASPATPELRRSRAMTRVSLTFEPVEGGTQVTLVHDEMGEGGEWPTYRAYFEGAWGVVLSNLANAFAADAD